MIGARKSIITSGDVFRDEFSLAFDGTNDYIEIPQQTHALASSNFSYVFWVKRNVTNAAHNILGHTASGSKHIRFSSDGFLQIETNTSGDLATGVLSINDTNWHHYAVVVGGGNGTVSMYQDGVSISVTSPDIGDSFSFKRIGQQGDGRYFNGNISEIAIYNKALSVSEVKTLYNGREPYNHKEGVCLSNLQAWYRMGDGLLDGNRTFSHTQSNDDSTQDNIISDESNSGLGAELYTFANALSTSAHESTNITTDGASTYTNGFRAFTGTTVELESSITNGSSHAFKYTTDDSSEGFRIDLSEHVDDSGNGLDVGSVYQISVDARHIGTGDGNAVHSVRIAENSGMGTTGETLVLFNISKTMTTYRNYKVYFIYDDTTTRYFGAREANSDNDSGGLYIDNLSIKKVNGNAGIMNNFSFQAIKGDTP